MKAINRHFSTTSVSPLNVRTISFLRRSSTAAVPALKLHTSIKRTEFIFDRSSLLWAVRMYAENALTESALKALNIRLNTHDGKLSLGTDTHPQRSIKFFGRSNRQTGIRPHVLKPEPDNSHSLDENVNSAVDDAKHSIGAKRRTIRVSNGEEIRFELLTTRPESFDVFLGTEAKTNQLRRLVGSNDGILSFQMKIHLDVPPQIANSPYTSFSMLPILEKYLLQPLNSRLNMNLDFFLTLLATVPEFRAMGKIPNSTLIRCNTQFKGVEISQDGLAATITVVPRTTNIWKERGDSDVFERLHEALQPLSGEKPAN